MLKFICPKCNTLHYGKYKDFINICKSCGFTRSGRKFYGPQNRLSKQTINKFIQQEKYDV